MQLFSGNDAMANFADLRSAALMYDRVFTLWEKVSAAMLLPWMPLKYEDLISDPESQMRALIGFLGLPWTAALLDHTSTVAKRRRINTPSYQQVARPLHRESLGRWVHYARHFEPLVPLLRRLTSLAPFPADTLLNINLPPVPPDEQRGVRLTRLGRRVYSNSIQPMRDPWGREIYWIGGGEISWQGSNDSDFQAIRDGCVSVTPLHLDLTHKDVLDTRERWWQDP